MPPIVLASLPYILKYAPITVEWVQKLVATMRHPDPSQADWDSLFKDIADLDYQAAMTAARDRADKAGGAK